MLFDSSTIELYKVTGDSEVNADACALKYVEPTRRKKDMWDPSSVNLPMHPGASDPPAMNDAY